MSFRDHLSGILEGFEDADGVIRDVKTEDILTAMLADLDPVWRHAQDLREALRPFADLLEDPEEFQSTEFQCYVDVQDIAYAQNAIAWADGADEQSPTQG